MNNILVLPGTKWQVPLIKKLLLMGHDVHVCNPVKYNFILELTNKFLVSDIFDNEKIIKYCYKNNIDAVMSDECDIATNVVSKLNSLLGSRYLPNNISTLFTNKFYMRKFCEKFDFNTVPYALCFTREDALDFFYSQKSTLIMKPLDSNASHGVFIIKSEDDIKRHFKESKKYSRVTPSVLLEKYIEGKEFTVDGIMTNDGHTSLAVSMKKHYEHNQNVARFLLFEQRSLEYDYDFLRQYNDKLINSTGLSFGLTHVEYKFCEGKYYLIEMAARGGGNLISASIVPYMSGVDNYDVWIKTCLNKNYNKEISLNIDNEKTAILKFLDLKNKCGKVKHIYGLDYLHNEAKITNFELSFKEGDYIQEPSNDSARLGYYIAFANSMPDLNNIISNVAAKLKIIID